MKKTYQKPVKKIKYNDAIKMINPMDREAFAQEFYGMKKIPENIIREWLNW